MGFYHKAYPFQEFVFKDSLQPKPVEQRGSKNLSAMCAGCRADRSKAIASSTFSLCSYPGNMESTQPRSEALQVLLPMFQRTAAKAQMIPKHQQLLFVLHRDLESRAGPEPICKVFRLLLGKVGLTEGVGESTTIYRMDSKGKICHAFQKMISK